jgi:hypothetical protein
MELRVSIDGNVLTLKHVSHNNKSFLSIISKAPAMWVMFHIKVSKKQISLACGAG